MGFDAVCFVFDFVGEDLEVVLGNPFGGIGTPGGRKLLVCSGMSARSVGTLELAFTYRFWFLIWTSRWRDCVGDSPSSNVKTVRGNPASLSGIASGIRTSSSLLTRPVPQISSWFLPIPRLLKALN